MLTGLLRCKAAPAIPASGTVTDKDGGYMDDKTSGTPICCNNVQKKLTSGGDGFEEQQEGIRHGGLCTVCFPGSCVCIVCYG